ncbi:aminoacyl-histidine dipeptidase [Moraxella nasovis]|uniref:aminoacyl-histidine dipeptidase n=1 Tax=Moraxella nasovis TaxID=2904121 RepID=UPI001F61CE4A|nr:aminoacyl-histidine dipeptidase [Moraxella nasovis]UNU73948.1 aminoacyl-histidine dipeptidase [Moraxella nasovis]
MTNTNCDAVLTHNLELVKHFTEDKNLASLWSWFARICATPHPSYHEETLAQMIVAWAKSQNLEVYRDSVGNVIIKKCATKGYENRTPIALQAHLDMVPQANADTPHDFSVDPIKLRLDGDWLMATGTTLGADNGIGMASCLAVLASDDLPHPRLEVLLTMTEETGMVGVKGLQAGTLTAPIMINTDTEEIGEVYIGCAGGIDADLSLPVDWEDHSFNLAIDLTIKGLKGGHSGLDIDQNRSNAIKVLARLLKDVHSKHGDKFAIASILGGTLRNAIARESNAVIVLDAADEQEILTTVQQSFEAIFTEICHAEKNAKMITAKTDLPSCALSLTSTAKVIDFINVLPSGVVRFSDVAEDTVETSLSFGMLSLGDKLEAVLLIRSLLESGKTSVMQTLSSLAALAGAQAVFDGDYVGWNPDLESNITPLTVELYEQILGEKPQVKVIHAGLECGLIKQSHPDLDIVSIGPTIKNAHSPDEKVQISTVETYWQLLIKILANAPKA